MKMPSNTRIIPGLLIATVFFVYCGAYVLFKEIESPTFGHYFGACLIPGILIIYLIREMVVRFTKKGRGKND